MKTKQRKSDGIVNRGKFWRKKGSCRGAAVHRMQGRRKKQRFRDAEQRRENAAGLKTVRSCWNGESLQNVILDMVNRFGYVGVLILIAVENVFPPIPSEVILTFGGFLTTCTRLHPAGVVLSSTAGSLLGGAGSLWSGNACQSGES